MNSFPNKTSTINKNVNYGHSEQRNITSWHPPVVTPASPQQSSNMTTTVTSHLLNTFNKSSTQSFIVDTTKQGRSKLFWISCSITLWKNIIKLFNLWELPSVTHIDIWPLDLIWIIISMSGGCLKTLRKIELLELKDGRGMFWKMSMRLSFIRIKECFIPKLKTGGPQNSIIKSLTHSPNLYYNRKILQLGFTSNSAKTSHT